MVPPSKNVTSPSGEWNSYYIRISYEENLEVLVHNKEEVLRFPLRGAQWDSLVEKVSLRLGHILVNMKKAILVFKPMMQWIKIIRYNLL